MSEHREETLMLGEHPCSQKPPWKAKGGVGSREVKMLLVAMTPLLDYSPFSFPIRLELG